MEGEGQQQQQQEKEQEQQQSGTTREGGGFQGLKNHVMANLVDTVLWATRLLTLIFCLLYLLPIVGNPTSSYQKALMSNAATSALRLHQRVTSVQFSREFLAQLLLEDSAHYLLYSVVFMYTSPITMVLLPVFLFALLHFASYSLALLDVLGQNNALALRFLISFVEHQQRNILRGAAFVEIFLMPLVAISLFLGRVTLLTPFLYYRFLFLRYSSRRNPYTRTMFYELRISAEYAINKPGVPSFLRNGVLRAISFLSDIAPVVQTQ